MQRNIFIAALAGMGLSIGLAFAQPFPALIPHYNDPSAPYGYRAVAGSQFALSITSVAVVKLTVPANAVCATITVETAPVRRTSDGTAPTSTVGTLMPTSYQLLYDCGPLSSYKFIAVSTTATLDVEYFY